jgi:hypothetical protein
MFAEEFLKIPDHGYPCAKLAPRVISNVTQPPSPPSFGLP